MDNIKFNNVQEFKSYFDKEHVEIAKTIARNIYDSFHKHKDMADILQVILMEEGLEFTIGVPKTDWVHSLTKCEEIFSKAGENDLAFNAYLLIKEIND